MTNARRPKPTVIADDSSRSRAQSVLLALRDAIMSGAFAPGERLTEERLSEQFKVSRVPVREALKVLETEGFLTLERYKGATVNVLTPEDASDLFSVREVVESLTASRAARLRSPAELLSLEEILARGQSAHAAGRASELPALNTAFHLGIARAAGSSSLLNLLNQLSAKIQWLVTSDLDRRAESSWTEHEWVIDAIRDGDGDAAGAHMRAHVANSRASLLFRFGGLDGQRL